MPRLGGSAAAETDLIRGDSVSSNTIVLVFTSPGVHAWVGEVALVLEPHFMGLSLMPSGKRLAKAFMPKPPEGGSQINRLHSPGVNAWAREMRFNSLLGDHHRLALPLLRVLTRRSPGSQSSASQSRSSVS